MSLFDRFLGRREPPSQDAPPRSEDELALERYRYMLRTAPPDQIERAHEEAFARLSPEQRQMLLAELSAQVPPGEQARSDDPRAMARMATRAEMRQPGTIERALGGVPMGGFGGFGGMLGGTLLGSLVGSFLGTAIAMQFFDDVGYQDHAFGDAGYGGPDAQPSEMMDQGFGGGEDLAVEEDLGDVGGDMI
jgi:hypothetical protein